MKLRFNDPEEFLQELRNSPPNVEAVLRLTVRRRTDRQLGGIHHVTVVAGYLRRLLAAPSPLAVIVTLEAYQGEDWGADFEGSRETRRRVEAVLTQLRTAAGEQGLRCRPGVYESSAVPDHT